jgi:hypothetical protein
MALAVGAWGLYRLRGWAVVLGVLGEIGVVLLAVLGMAIGNLRGLDLGFGAGDMLVYGAYGASGVAALGILGIVLASVARGRELRLPEPPAWAARHLRWLAILGLWGTVMAGVVLKSYP